MYTLIYKKDPMKPQLSTLNLNKIGNGIILTQQRLF